MTTSELIVLALIAAVAAAWLVVRHGRRVDAVAVPEPTVVTAPPKPATTSDAIATVTIPSRLEPRLQKLMAEKGKIHAIKELRDHSQMSLRDAKEAIDRLALAPFSPASTMVAAPTSPHDLDDDFEAHLRQLLADKRKIYAIKELRAHTQMSLRDAKELLERL